MIKRSNIFMMWIYTYIFMRVCSVTQPCPILLQPHGLQPTGPPLSVAFPRQDTAVHCQALLWGYFWPRDRTLISCGSCIGRWIIYHCATWEALKKINIYGKHAFDLCRMSTCFLFSHCSLTLICVYVSQVHLWRSNAYFIHVIEDISMCP